MEEAARPSSGSLGPDDRGNVSPSGDGDKRKRGFPAPVTILGLVLILVWMSAFFIPSGQYELDGSGSPIAGSFRYVAPPLDFGGRFKIFCLHL